MNGKLKRLTLSLSRTNSLYTKWYEGMSVSGVRQEIILALITEPGISQKEIVSSYLIPKQTVSKEILLMEKEGLLELLSDDKDKRRKKIVITDKGYRYAENILKPYFDLEERIEIRMGSEAYSQLIENLSAYAEALYQEVNS